MNAIILAGGEGTRLKTVTGDEPKPMAKLCGKPVLEHVLNLLKRSGITGARITLRYRPERIRDYFGDGSKFGMRLSYHEETVPLGTAGAVRACAEYYGDRDFLVIAGDCACDFDLAPLLEAHRRHRPAVTMALYACESPLQYGIVLTDALHRVVRFAEKPDWPQVVSDLVNTGIYVVSPEAMKYVPADTPFDFAKDLFPKLLETGHELRGIPLEGYWCDVGTPEAYHQCNLDALHGLLHLEDTPAPALPRQAYFTNPDAGTQLLYRCRSRARLMRLLSESLMEAGADFSDGLTLDSESGHVRVSPAPDSEAVIISAGTADPAASGALARRVEALARRLEETAEKEKD